MDKKMIKRVGKLFVVFGLLALVPNVLRYGLFDLDDVLRNGLYGWLPICLGVCAVIYARGGD